MVHNELKNIPLTYEEWALMRVLTYLGGSLLPKLAAGDLTRVADLSEAANIALASAPPEILPSLLKRLEVNTDISEPAYQLLRSYVLRHAH